MRLTVASAEARVLVRDAGAHIAQTVHALIDQGAHVDVHADPSSIAGPLADLASRRLVRIVGEPDLMSYDVVVRDLRRGAGTPTRTREPAPAGMGRVVLVGGGPGDPGLLTLAGMAAISDADVVVCDRLGPLGVLDELDPSVEIVHVGKIPRGESTTQERINAVLIDRARAGKTVVRLKGGDSFVFGRGGEEWNACVDAGIAVSVVPGVTSSVAAPALAGIPVTHRGVSQGFVVVSGHVAPNEPRSAVDWSAVGRTGMTVVVLMGVAALDSIAATLIAHGMEPTTPAAAVADAGLPSQRVVRADLAALADTVRTHGLSPPAVAVIGPAVDVLHKAAAPGRSARSVTG